MEIELTRRGVKVGSEELPLISASMQYWRVERKKWPAILDLVAELGFGMLETYVPWSVHELERGRFDFGENNPDLDLPAFIELIAERKLKLIVRPGPHINAELTLFGYPERVLRDPACRSVSVDGDPVWVPLPFKMWPAPSYAADKFYQEVGLWFDAVAPRLQGRLAGAGGPIVAVQVDNEFCNLFRNSPYDHDYHPDALRRWGEFMKERRGPAPAPPPPRAFAAKSKQDLPLYLDWVEFKEDYMRRALFRLRRMWEERGVKPVLFFSNYPVGADTPPSNWAELETGLDVHGPDIYPTRRQYQALKTLCLLASGTSRLPMIPEFSSGSFFWSAPLEVRDQEFTTPACFMHGIKAINFYMIVERERWYGSPITRDGRKRPKQWEFFKGLLGRLKAARLHELEKQTGAILLSVRDYDRLSQAASILDPIPPLASYIIPALAHASADDFGFSAPIQLEHEARWAALFHGLSAAKVPFDLGNTSQGAEALARYRMVLLATYDFLDAEVQRRLLAHAQAGGTLAIGPLVPSLDADMRPCSILRDALAGEGEELAGGRARGWKVGQGRVVIIPEALPKAGGKERPETTTQLLAAIAEAVGLERPYPADDPMIETSLHRGEDREVLFMANPTRDERVAKIALPPGAKLLEWGDGESFTGPEAAVPMAGFTVRVFEIKP